MSDGWIGWLVGWLIDWLIAIKVWVGWLIETRKKGGTKDRKKKELTSTAVFIGWLMDWLIDWVSDWVISRRQTLQGKLSSTCELSPDSAMLSSIYFFSSSEMVGCEAGDSWTISSQATYQRTENKPEMKICELQSVWTLTLPSLFWLVEVD